MNISILEQPYPGLRPFNETEQDIFFGRESDKLILIDKILANNLTLLFSASGVGKSSLLNASIIPHFRSSLRENLVVAYVADWVIEPFDAINAAVIKAFQDKGLKELPKISVENLKDDFNVYSSFFRSPLVLILDQFEEFFRYHHNAKKKSDDFINEITNLIKCTELPLSIVISMREDFALELNIFKKQLPVTFFDNFYRLERLNCDQLKMAINEPIRRLGWSYEDGLVDDIIKELSESKISLSASSNKNESDFFENRFELGYMQIVCGFLWSKTNETNNNVIKFDLYTKYEGAIGILGEYLKTQLDSFNLRERFVVQRLFDFLMSPPGFKVAYTVPALTSVTRFHGRLIEYVLNKLTAIKIVKKIKLTDDIYYQLSHDMYNRLIIDWRSKYILSREYSRGLVWHEKKRSAKLSGGFKKVLLILLNSTVKFIDNLFYSFDFFFKKIIFSVYGFFDYLLSALFNIGFLIKSFIVKTSSSIYRFFNKKTNRIIDFLILFRNSLASKKESILEDLSYFLLFLSMAIFFIDFSLALDMFVSFIKGLF